MAVEKGNVVVVEHEFAAPVARVFGALREGRLFFNCGAWPEKTQIDFRPGGKYRLDFAHYGKTHGEFTEIVENKRVAFTWNSDEMEIHGTSVRIELTASAKGCKVILRHEGFADVETAESHEGGWMSGLQGMDQEATKFVVHLEREFVAPVAMLYEACLGSALFSHLGAAPARVKADFRVGGKFSVALEGGEARGEFLEIEKEKRIVFTWDATKVTIEFGPWGDGGKNSYMELTQDGCQSAEAALAQHRRWNETFWGLYKRVCRQ